MMDGQRVRTLWVSRRDHLPRKAREVAHAAQELAVTETWSKLQRDVDIPDSLFQWTPPETWTQYYEPNLDSQTIPPGNPAPEVDLPLGGGGRFRLSAMRGKVVLLNFWRVGCPPCRQEIPFLQELYTQRGGPGFAVVGVNTADDPSRVRALLAACGANYPVIIDTTRAAAELARQFGPDAVPLTYIIGIEGNVCKGWFGFDKEASPPWIREELAKLGVH
jgi:peroxiredoxin